MKRKVIAPVGLDNYSVGRCDLCRTYRNYRIIVALVVRDFANFNALLIEHSLDTYTIVKDPLSKDCKKDKEIVILQVLL